MDHTLYALLLILLLLLLRRPTLTCTSADAPTTLPSSAACTDELVTFSSCLPFIAVFPNNLTDFPPPQCCDDVSAAFGNGSGICLCYFVSQPKILGFPLNSTKLFSLTSFCPAKDHNRTAKFSLETLCSESAVLPPLRSITGPNNSNPSKSGPESPPPPLVGPAQESTDNSSTKEPASDMSPFLPSPSTISSAARQIFRLSWTLLSLYLYKSISVQATCNQ